MKNPTEKSADPYGGVALGVEAAWPLPKAQSSPRAVSSDAVSEVAEALNLLLEVWIDEAEKRA